MDTEMKRHLADSIREFHLPRYDQIPDVGLYLEQTTKYINGYLAPLGCMELLKAYGIETAGKHAVVIGRSMIVGKPMANLLVAKKANATVTIAHSRTKDLPGLCRTADIIVAAVGRAEMVKTDYVKEGAVVLDVGINRIADETRPRGYRIVGDVDFEDVKDKCSYITPVPGGVGPMTIAMLMANTVKACRQLTR